MKFYKSINYYLFHLYSRMSIVAFKKKSIIQYGSKRSGVPTDVFWLSQGPFGLPKSLNSVMLEESIKMKGLSGFSLNGPKRNVGYVGQSMSFSKNGTPFRGVYPRGSGGVGGTYPSPLPVFNVPPVYAEVLGNQEQFNKPSVLSTRGMLRQKYRWAYTGKFPNYWVQPNYGSSNLSDNTSQGLYIHEKTVANDCVVDVNAQSKYVGNFIRCGPCGCRKTPARGYKMVIQQSNAPYGKQIKIPQAASQQTIHVQRKCVDQTKEQKPYPYATNGDSCNVGLLPKSY